ncbi:hypothetical protein EWM64_g9061 [Hericium alpestre]|uniref:peptidyl-tRNA hydrolase n=1 Tax=Hericium alpestre TaxID=135208 RepID=A0A4Y9ZJQ0_9AGAM|nr:hypothetical protein EWM64_g9061 [Hericium alpestre]
MPTALMPRELTAILAAIALGSASLGYWLGRVRTRNALSTASKDEHADGTESEVAGDGDLAGVKAGLFEDTKLVLVVRSDLGMSTGKVAAQMASTVQTRDVGLLQGAFYIESRSTAALGTDWTKIALRCNDAEEMNLLQAKAQSLDLCARSIQDAGRTQIAAGSRTVLGIGPGAYRAARSWAADELLRSGPARLINQVTGKLKLL